MVSVIDDDNNNTNTDNINTQSIQYYSTTYRCELLAVASPHTANIDENCVRAVFDFSSPIARGQRDYIGREGVSGRAEG